MSELIEAAGIQKNLHWHLLTSVSLLALVGGVAANAQAMDDSNRPPVWIEFGGQMENVEGQGDAFVPGLLAANPTSPVLNKITPVQAQEPPASFGGEGKVSMQPGGSDWVFSAAILYGRSGNFRHVDHQTKGLWYSKYVSGVGKDLKTKANYADTQAHHQESHAILDFSAGQDVGLGLFGRDSSSTLSLGVRFAQFTSKAALDIRARPDLQFKHLSSPAYHITFNLPHFHSYHVTGQASRSFHGIGPSLSWNGSAPFVGDKQDGEVTVDWGANAALLFGRQRARVQHQETAHYYSPYAHFRGRYYALDYQHPPAGHDTVRSVIVPNVGGFAGVSWRVRAFKASLGYRADFFFGAMDGGIDARRSETLDFHGPFATISIGLGG